MRRRRRDAAQPRGHRAGAHRAAVLGALAIGACVAACIIPAPIEEEIPEVDVPPTVDQLTQISPELGDHPVDLTFGAPQSFAFFTVEDPNLDQTLYWRAIVDYGEVAVSAPIELIAPDQREDLHGFQYAPCFGVHAGVLQSPDVGSNLVVLIGIADEPFADTRQFLEGPTRIADALRTENDRQVAVIVWGVFLVGECPARGG